PGSRASQGEATRGQTAAGASSRRRWWGTREIQSRSVSPVIPSPLGGRFREGDILHAKSPCALTQCTNPTRKRGIRLSTRLHVGLVLTPAQRKYFLMNAD